MGKDKAVKVELFLQLHHYEVLQKALLAYRLVYGQDTEGGQIAKDLLDIIKEQVFESAE